ncbi:MAG: hypothetical protein AAGG48_00875 [Planctomycetota bacterium]
MPRVSAPPRTVRRVTPSIVDPEKAKPFTMEQELKPFGKWVGNPIWVPPKDSSVNLAESMLRSRGWFRSKEERWKSVVAKHRNEFTQVREIDLFRSSIRLPMGRFFVSVTEQRDFDKITDTIPACVQTRLDEFLAGPGKARGVKVYYLKPLCVEAGEELILTTREDLNAAIDKIRDEVFEEYSSRYLLRRSADAMVGAFNMGLSIPRGIIGYCVRRRQRQIEAYHAHLEFKRRQTALRAARTHEKFRTDGCTFDEMLALTNPLQTADVITQFGVERNLSKAKQEQLIRMAAGTVPWFVALSLTAWYVSTLTLTLGTPVMVCDPAFIAQMPGSNGTVLKIGHFDEVGGVTHVEI